MLRSFTVLLLLLAATPAARAKDSIDFTPIESVAKAEMEETKVPGAVIVVVRGDRVVYARGFGLATVEGTEPPTPDHLFRAGSTTKMFVGAALAKLAEAGKLNLHEPVGKLVDGLPPKVAALTPHQILTHTSGLSDDLPWYGRHDDAALGDGIKVWKDSRLFTQAGDVYSYSNPGYWLAGYCAECAGGKPFADVLASELFQPLGMKRTTFRPTMAMTYPLAQGHELRGGKPAVVRPAADNSATWPAGSMFTSGNDLSRFVIAFLNNGKINGEQVLSESLLKTIASPHAELPGGRGHYGYGLQIQRLRGVETIAHGGSRTGYGSRIVMAPKHKFGVIVLANRTGASLPKTVEKVLELSLPLAAESKVKAGPMPLAEELEKLAGIYRNGSNSIELKWVDGKLVRGGAKQQPLKPLGGLRFRLSAIEQYEFATGKDGKTPYLYRGSRAFRKVEE
jgi:CubicO group peptidase (beta-lactamase class C family)